MMFTYITGASLHIKNNREETAFDIARRFQEHEICELLQEAQRKTGTTVNIAAMEDDFLRRQTINQVKGFKLIEEFGELEGHPDSAGIRSPLVTSRSLGLLLFPLRQFVSRLFHFQVTPAKNTNKQKD